MANKKTANPEGEEHPSAPGTLDRHTFYGLQLDEHQKMFRDAIWDKGSKLVICEAEAGTGKSLIAYATANLLCDYNRYRSFVSIASPVNESRQGFLPGDIGEKSNFYFSPAKQALNKIKAKRDYVCDMNYVPDKSKSLFCMTDSFIRGVNFDNTVGVLDECQNYTISQLRTILSRFSDNCKVICIGSLRQIDIPNSGFASMIKQAEDLPWARICKLSKNYRGELSAWADSLI